MSIKTIRAVICFITPSGGQNKNVNWSLYEAKALLTTSTSSREAFNRFLIHPKRIIEASKKELQYLYTIWFYEEINGKNGSLKSINNTLTIKIGKDMELEVLIDD